MKPWQLAALVFSLVMSLLGLSGLAEGVVEWRCFIQEAGIFRTYLAFRDALIGLAPFRVPTALFDYLVIHSSFLATNRVISITTDRRWKAISAGRPEQPKSEGARPKWYRTINLLFAPVIFVLTLVIFRLMIRRIGDGRPLETAGPSLAFSERVQLHRDLREIEITVYWSIVLYLAFVVGFLFLATDVLYTIFGVAEIGGVPFNHVC